MQYMLTQARKQQFVTEFRHRLENINELPALPETAVELLALKNNPDSDINDLVGVIARDPAVSAQLLRYSRLSMFGYGERIHTLDEAIGLVLGYDKALHLAMGLVAGKCLIMQSDGPLGRRAFWGHSFATAILCRFLARTAAKEHELNPSVAYLAGLMHDIGFMLIGHFYPDEFTMLNQLVQRYYDKEPRELELLSLGVSHDMVGYYLMQAWKMPEEILVAVSEHHFPEYGGRHHMYAKLIYFANHLQREASNQRRALDEQQFLICQELLGLNDGAVQEGRDLLKQVNAEIALLVEDMAA